MSPVRPLKQKTLRLCCVLFVAYLFPTCDCGSTRGNNTSLCFSMRHWFCVSSEMCGHKLDCGISTLRDTSIHDSRNGDLFQFEKDVFQTRCSTLGLHIGQSIACGFRDDRITLSSTAALVGCSETPRRTACIQGHASLVAAFASWHDGLIACTWRTA